MSGFCPDDWHGTTMDDIYQMQAGEDYHFYADFFAPRRRLPPTQPVAAAPLCGACGGEGSVQVIRKDGDTESWPCRECTTSNEGGDRG